MKDKTDSEQLVRKTAIFKIHQDTWGGDDQ